MQVMRNLYQQEDCCKY